MANGRKRGFGKKLFVVITLALSAGTLLYFLYTTDGIETLGHILTTLKPQWLGLAVFSAAAGWFIEGWALDILCRHLRRGWHYGRSFLVGMTGLLYSALTPFSTGGQPMQIYVMSNMGMDAGTAGSIIAVKTLIYQVVMVAYSLVMVILKLRFFQTNVSNFAFITVIGLVTNCIFIALVVLFMISEKTTDRILRIVLQFLHRLKLCKHPQERYEKIHGQLQLFHDASRIMGNSSRMYLSATAVTVFQITLGSLIPYFIYRSFNMHEAPVTTMVAAQVFVAMVSAFVPLPGASGGAELSFYGFFGLFFQSAIIPAILLWRIITYYANILFGGVFAYVGSKLGRIRDGEEPGQKKTGA